MKLMPPEQPLGLPLQDFGRDFRDRAAPGARVGGKVWLSRLLTFAPASLTTLGISAAFYDWFSVGGLNWLEMLLITLVALTFFWIALSVSTATLGFFALMRGPRAEAAPAARSMKTALLVPIYNEVPWDVFGNAAAMMQELRSAGSAHEFTLFILSDTRDEAIARIEARGVAMLREELGGAGVFYRRRADNVDRKVGNLSDWVARWGGGFEAMLVLDADSLMTGAAITELTDELSRDPTAGLIQSFPQLFGARTVFGRVQQFSSAVYGALLAEGLATWAGREGNYWGHNAIIRTQAFAASAGLPRLDTLRRKDALILSHDFVEAGLLRRAGWGVRFLPRIKGSYEEAPQTVVDYVLRDRRWCQGNLQHLNLLGSTGFHAVTRFHLFHGAMGYLLSPVWFVLLLIWAVLGKGEEASVITYFSEHNPLMPQWPVMSSVDNLLILLFMYAMLLAPKIMGAMAIYATGISLASLGGLRQFVLSLVSEIGLSIAYAPVLMVQQVMAVLRNLLGLREGWVPQNRAGGVYTLGFLVRFHVVETVVGALLVLGMVLGLVSLWMLPIAASLVMAVPLSAMSGVDLTARRWSRRNMGTPAEFERPAVIRRAQHFRRVFQAMLQSPAE